MRVGFIGLGIMGKPMTRNLIRAGHQLVVYDIVPERIAEMSASGVAVGQSASDVAARSQVTITMVPTGPRSKPRYWAPKARSKEPGPARSLWI